MVLKYILVFLLFLSPIASAQSDLLRKIKTLPPEVAADSLQVIYVRELFRQPADSTLPLLDNLLEFAARSDNKQLEIEATLCLAAFYFNNIPDGLDQGKRLYERALILSEKYGKKKSAIRMNHLYGYALIQGGEVSEGLKRVLHSDYQMQQIGYDSFPGAGAALINTARVYFQFGNYERGLNYAKLGRKYIDSSDTWLFVNYNLLGILYSELGQLDSAFYYFDKAGHQSLKANDSISYGAVLANLGILNTENGRLQKGEELLLQGLAVNRRHNHIPYAISCLLHLIKTEAQLGNVSAAESYAEEVRSLMESAHMLNLEAWATYYEGVYELARVKRNFLLAFAYVDTLRQLEDSISTTINQDMVMNLTLQLEADKYMTDLQLLENEKALQNARIEILHKQKAIDEIRRYVILGIASVLIIFFVWLWRMSRRKIKTDRLEFDKQLIRDKKELDEFRKRIAEKNAIIENFRKQLPPVENANGHNELMLQLDQSTILTEDDWLEFKRLFSRVYPRFLDQLVLKYPHLTGSEIRLLVLIKLNFSVSEMSSTLGILPESVRKTRLRVTKKLDLEDHKQLISFVDTF